MLITCPECELPVSDKALSCPHCGNPMKAQTTTRQTTRKKRMRLPNGFGQISEIKGGNLRNRYRAMVTIGKTEEGKPICKILKPQGYFRTYNEAYAALVKYHKDPYDLDDSATMDELHSLWVKKHYPTLTGKSLKYSYDKAWARCSLVHKMRVVDVRPRHLKACIDVAPTPNTKKLMKIMLNVLYDFFVEEEYVSQNYARAFHLDKSVSQQADAERKSHISFSREELDKLWDGVGRISYVDAILIQTYMGWRPGELCLLRIEDVNLEKGFIVGGIKTKAGKRRLVPIHECIRTFVERRLEEAEFHKKEHLINCLDSSDGIMTYSKYHVRFHAALKGVGIAGHQPHDPRKTFVTMCKNANVDEYALKRMVGHSIKDITESVYTERTVEWLATEISKIDRRAI